MPVSTPSVEEFKLLINNDCKIETDEETSTATLSQTSGMVTYSISMPLGWYQQIGPYTTDTKNAAVLPTAAMLPVAQTVSAVQTESAVQSEPVVEHAVLPDSVVKVEAEENPFTCWNTLPMTEDRSSAVMKETSRFDSPQFGKYALPFAAPVAKPIKVRPEEVLEESDLFLELDFVNETTAKKYHLESDLPELFEQL